MRKLTGNKNGQFVLIAVLIIAIMIISIGTIMHRAMTYYKNEPWDEYSMLMSNVELSSRRVAQMSLSNLTNAQIAERNYDVLRTNFAAWQENLAKIYPGYGIMLNYSVANGTSLVNGASVQYLSGLNCTWNQRSSFSAANASLMLDVDSIGLHGYRFDAMTLLNLTIINEEFSSSTVKINATVTREGLAPVIGLKTENFQIDGFTYTSFNVTATQDQNYSLLYVFECHGVPSAPSQFTVSACDERGIKVIAKYP